MKPNRFTADLLGKSCGLLASLLLGLALPGLHAAISEGTVFFDVPESLITEAIPAPTPGLDALPGYPDDDDRLTLAGQLFLPDPNLHGNGPYPVVVILHGSGGAWSNDVIANGLLSHLDQWGVLLADLGYAALLPDSYNPRGIPGSFAGRRPHWDPADDDHLCSPNYERPKDVIAALEYLDSRSDIDRDNIALMGFSHGAQTAMNAIVDVSVDLGQYTVSAKALEAVPNTNPVQYIEVDELEDVPSPVRIPNDLPFPKLCVFYYGGGSHYRYHGSANDTGAGRFMFDRRTQVLMFHGTDDYLLDVDDPLAPPPMTGNLYPIKQVLASSAQAAAEGVDDPMQHHLLLDQAAHSFDLATIADPQDWNTNAESADQKAKRICREEVLKWLQACLMPGPATSLVPVGPDPEDVNLSTTTHTRLEYQWQDSDDLVDWFDLGTAFDGSGNTEIDATSLAGNRRFYRLDYRAIPPPLDDPDNAGFFRDYSEFDTD